MTNSNFDKLFGKKRRDPNNEKLTQFHMDIVIIQKLQKILCLSWF